MPRSEVMREVASGESDALWLARWTARAWRRWRALIASEALVWALAGGSTVVALTGAWIAAGAVAVVVAAVRAVGSRAWHDVAVLLVRVEQQAPALRNALLTWHETAVSGLDVPDVVRARLVAQARGGLVGQAVPDPRGRLAWTAAAGALLLGVGLFTASTWVGPLLHVRSSVAADRTPTDHRGPPDGGSLAMASLHVGVQPPPYLARAAETYDDPDVLDVLEGSLVTVAYGGVGHDVVAYRGETRLDLTERAGRRTASFTADTSTVLLASTPDGAPVHAMTLRVVPDRPPDVRVDAPGRDLRPTRIDADIAVTIVAQDDHGLHDLRLVYTTVSGSGETFTFADGHLPVTVERESATTWRASSRIRPAALGLGPGDSLVYYAVARDGRSSEDGRGESDRYLVEIPRPGELGGGDFSLPDTERRYALSQRMVIELTERLIAQRERLDAEAFVREAQGLARQQRRVRAEFVFLMGGDVVDEVEEAEHSHEIEAGRLDNSGQQALLEAVRQMSLAEQRLVAGDAVGALPFEYRALQALQAAFGQARYFMRTLPSRVAIDLDRRLTGDRYLADPSTWDRQVLTPHDREQAVRLLGELRELSSDSSGEALRRLGAALMAFDATSPDWQDAVGRLTATLNRETSLVDQEQAIDDVAAHLQARVAAQVPIRLPIRLPLGRVDADRSAGAAARR
jgi:hypothetical protein